MFDASPPLNQWTIQVLDRESCQDEKGWQKHLAMSPQERVALIEHLRTMWHGQADTDAGVQRVFELIERVPS